MSHTIARTAIALAIVGTGLLNSDTASAQTIGTPVYASNRVAYKTVQHTPRYNLRRAEVPSGAQLTLFANFLGERQGVVLLQLAGTSFNCEMVQWKKDSVTVEMPRLGLREPKNAAIQIVLPNGRIAKTFRVLYVSPPNIIVHGETVPVATPPAPSSSPALYATTSPW